MKTKDAIRLLFNPPALWERWEVRRISRLPRYQQGTTRLFGPPFAFVDKSSFCFQYDEIFRHRVYEFASDTPAPRIIDGGANIGLSALYFKRLFPRARVTAFEADRAVFAVLQSNLRACRLEDVELRPEALWPERGQIAYAPEGADGGRVDAGGQGAYQVATVPLQDLLAEPVDLLKLDIEGAEFEVLRAAAGQLGGVRKMFVEYHSFVDRPQMLPELLALLKDAGFRLYLGTPTVFSRQPLKRIDSYNGCDAVVNIFAVRASRAAAG